MNNTAVVTDIAPSHWESVSSLPSIVGPSHFDLDLMQGQNDWWSGDIEVKGYQIVSNTTTTYTIVCKKRILYPHHFPTISILFAHLLACHSYP